MMKSLPRKRLSNVRRRRYALYLWVFQAQVFRKNVQHRVRCIVLDGLLALCADLNIDARDQQTISTRGTYEENFLTELLPAFGKRFDRALADGCFSSIDQFQSSNQSQPKFLGSLTREIFDDEGRLRSDASIEAVRKVRQVCYYAYKTDFPYDPAKVEKVIASFVDTETELAAFGNLVESGTPANKRGVKAANIWSVKAPYDYVCCLSAKLVQDLFSRFSMREFKPRHGPGVTSNCDLHQKWTKRVDVGAPSGVFSRFYWWNTTDALDRIERYPLWDHRSYFTDQKEGNTASVKLVPKDSRGPRLISAEPVERQFIQQGLMAEICSIVESHWLTKGHVNFTDQSINQRLAVSASQSGYWATLDLKDASDRVSMDLVNTVFVGTELLELITQVRSSYTRLPNGEILRLRKHAPMGSALCFPIMAVTIWSLMVAYLCAVTGDFEFAVSSVYVYGDDIICPSDYAQDLSKCLEHFGLRVNRDKSFIRSRFAESCGVDAFDGIDVTPVRLRTVWGAFIGSSFDRAKAVVSLCAHARQLDKSGKPQSAEYYYGLVEELLQAKLPFASDWADYLGRFCLPEDFSVLHNEWADREQGGRRTSTVYHVRTQHVRGNDGLWAHLYRTYPLWGSPTPWEPLPAMGVFDVPRRVSLRQVKKLSFNKMKMKQFPVPEWVDTFMLARPSGGGLAR